MSDLHEQIDLLRAELRGCIDPQERFQILVELDAALAQAADQECAAGEFPFFEFPTG